MKRLNDYRNRFLVPLCLTLAAGCSGDPLDDPNSVESRAKTAADSCQAALDQVGKLFNQCNPTTSSAYVEMQNMLSAALKKISELQKELAMGGGTTTPACTAPDQSTVWRCWNPMHNPGKVDTRLVLLTQQQIVDFGYPPGGCYVGAQKLTSLGSNWFFGPVPSTGLTMKAVAGLEFPYDFKTDPAYNTATDWQCQRQ